MMRELIEGLFLPALSNPQLDIGADAVPLPLPADRELVVTTDGFTVKPLEFPGGNIGSLAVHGTVNDIAVSGAVPRFLTLSVFLEEGLEIATLRRVIGALAAAAQDCGVAVVAGDTKVLGRGDCDGMYLAATGIGFRRRGTRLAMADVRAGDRILVSGPVGDHGAAVLLARQEFGLQGDLRSDSASVLPAAQALLRVPGLRFMRDPTRGGLATVAHELAGATGLTLSLSEERIPVNEAVQAARLRSALPRLRGTAGGRGRCGCGRPGIACAAGGGPAGRADRAIHPRIGAGDPGHRIRRTACSR